MNAINGTTQKYFHAVSMVYEKDLVFFKKFHRNVVNQYIHAITIPLEWLGWVIVLRLLSPMHWIVTIVISFLIIIAKSRCSVFAAGFHILLAVVAQVAALDAYQALVVTVALQLLSWLTQVVIGHYILEKNNPAMMTKLTTASVAWSLCLCFDALWYP
jgi:uncharacterized membrane protein YGL010W